MCIRKTTQRRRFLSNSVAQHEHNFESDERLTILRDKAAGGLAYKKYILLTKNLLTALKALRQMFKSNEDPPLALEAESSN
jgi:hypothetical protein